MFTGIVEEIGEIVARAPRGAGARFTVRCSFDPIVMGESISVSGVCLTVDAFSKGPVTGAPPQTPARSLRRASATFEADASPETLERSTLRDARPGRKVNLERALTPQSRIGGHYVAGHADAVAVVLDRRPFAEASLFRVSLPASIARFVAPKGSIAIDGVSLTSNEVGPDWFEVVIVPHTLRATTLVDLRPGDHVTLEVDLLARYVARLLGEPRESNVMQKLQENGFTR